MSAYTDHVSLGPTPSGQWRLARPLQWEVGRKGSALWVVVPAGFESDLASIPFWARPWLNPADSRLAKAAVLHDWLLAKDWARTSATAEFAQALRADGIGKWKALIMGLAVLFYTSLCRSSAG